MQSYKSKLLAVLAITFLSFSSFRLLSQDYSAANTDGSQGLKVVNNPVIEGLGVCDPHIHIFNDKAYLFASHDREPGAKFYGMYDWWIWSSSDLVHWELEFNLFPTDMWVGATNNSWAVDGAERNGNYYFYVSGNWQTGVAISTEGPGGPYKDALGKSIPDISYDPTIFFDDDENKTPYIVTGHFPYEIAKLNEDMISLAEESRELIHDSIAWKGDGSYLHKRNGIYYLNGHGTRYCTATNIYGPYTYRGTYYKHWIDHPSIFNWNNQTFCAFGTRDEDRTFRKTHLTYVHYRDNGEIFADGDVGDSFIGVGQYDCSKKIEAEWYFAASDGIEKQEIETGFAVGGLTNNEYLYYQRILNLAENATINIQVSSANSGGKIEVRQDKANGKLLGTIEVPNTGSLSTYQSASTKIKSKEGLTNLYLVYKGNASANIDWLTLTSTGSVERTPKPDPIILAAKSTPSTPSVSAFNKIEAEDLIAYHLLRTGDTNDNGPARCLTHLKNTSYSSYKVDFGSEKNNSLKFQARLAARYPGSIEIRLDKPDGTLLGTCDFDSTGGPKDWITKECIVNGPSGVQEIFLVITGEEPEKYWNGYEILCLNWIKFVE